MRNTEVSETNELIERLKKAWTRQGVRIRPGAPFQRLEQFESQYHVHLPPDLRHYFATLDGMEQGEMDENMFSFLSIDAIKNIPEDLANFGGVPDYRGIMRTLIEPQNWFVIVDFLITSAVYAIRLVPDFETTSILWIGDGTRQRIVANSFSQFLEIYLSNPDSLL